MDSPMRMHLVHPLHATAAVTPAESRAYDYANHFEVGVSADEVLLRFAQAYEGVAPQAERACIVMTPAYAKALLELLSEAVADFEAEHGPLRAAGGRVVVQPPPAQQGEG
jgi:hypothetical protein